MLALIPIIGPTLAIVTVASWQIIKWLFLISPAFPSGSALPFISFAVWALAF